MLTEFNNPEYKREIRLGLFKTLFYTFLLKIFSYPNHQLTVFSISLMGFGVFVTNIIFQRILGVNRHVPFMLHYTSKVVLPGGMSVMSGPKNKVTFESLAAAPNLYIQAYNGVILGEGVFIGPSVKIISANHDPKNLTSHLSTVPVEIKDNVLLSADVVVLPGVTIGKNCIVGAGSIVTKNIPNNAVVIGNPARVIRYTDED